MIETALDIANAIQYGETILTAPEEDYNQIIKKIPGFKRKKYTFWPTNKTCRSATERVLELFSQINGDIFISIPMDESLLIPGQIEDHIGYVENNDIEILTLYCDFYCIEDAVSNLSAKIVTNNKSEILYMSRSVIPVAKNGVIDLGKLKKNVGVFYFRKAFLKKLKQMGNITTVLDKFEGLEQLRWLELGFTVKVRKVTHYGFGIDIPEQVKQLEKRKKCIQQLRN